MPPQRPSSIRPAPLFSTLAAALHRKDTATAPPTGHTAARAENDRAVRRRIPETQTASPGDTRGFGARMRRIWEARTKAYQPSDQLEVVSSG